MLLKFLRACIMVNPISIVTLLAAIVTNIFSTLIQYVVNARNHQPYPRIHPSSSDVIFNMSWISTNQIVVVCTPKLTQVIHP